MKNKQWKVFGWSNGSDYDAQKPANYTVTVTAADESEADTKGDKKLTREHGQCEVVVSQEIK